METLNFLFGLWGFSIAGASLALLISPGTIKKIMEKLADDAVMFMWGLVALAIGLANVLTYNVWGKDWGVIITILGWLAILRGITFLFAPAFCRSLMSKINQEWLPIILVATTILGCVLAYLSL